MKNLINHGLNQKGISLPIVLMFLLVISLLASVGIRRATLGELISRNQIELETARQAAEAALRDAERDLLLPNGTIRTNALCARGTDRPVVENLTAPAFSTSCTRGQCYFSTAYYNTTNYNELPTVTKPQPWWPTTNGKGGQWNNSFSAKPSDVAGANANCAFNGAVPLGTFTGTARLAAVAIQPEYIIERMKRGDDTFFRITARGFGTDASTEFVMQSVFRAFTE
jgi:type IV pilus assembly protein PilX